MKTLKINSLEKDWQESDILMLHSCFQILVDFVEKEIEPLYNGDNISILPENSKKNKKWLEELYDLYNWWKNRKEERKKTIDKLYVKLKPREIPRHTDIVKEEEEGGRYTFVDSSKFKKFWKTIDKEQEYLEIWDIEDQFNLKRLIRIRETLWT